VITRKQVADLQPGDVVEVIETCCGAEISHRGPLRKEQGRALALGDVVVISEDGTPRRWFHSLTVVSRAPRPLYVNHPRTEPVPGDVVDYSDGHFDGIGPWFAHRAREGSDLFWMSPAGPVLGKMPFPMRLLVNGENGQTVQ
jgi:hypothetical protein